MSQVNFKIKEVTTKESFLRCLPLLHELGAGEDFQALPEQISYQNFLKAHEQGYRQFYAECEDQIIGIIGLRSFYDPMEARHGYILNNFIITPKFRGKKVAEGMMLFVENYAKSNGGDWIIGWVIKGKERTMKWYQRLGYKAEYYLLEKNVTDGNLSIRPSDKEQ